MFNILKATEPGIVEYFNAITILGMPLVTFAFVLFISLGVFGFLFILWWDRWRLNQHKRESAGKIICEFVPENGGLAYWVLCAAYKMELRKVETKSRATFMTDAFFKAPKGHSIDAYYPLPEHDYLDWYPRNCRQVQQVKLQKYYFVENDPCPKMPHDPSRWDTERYVRITSAIAKLAKDESNLQVLVSEMSGVWQNIAEFVQKLKMIPILMYCIIGLALINLFTAFMVFQSNNGIQQLVKFLVGK
jgi:hypothetical protein